MNENYWNEFYKGGDPPKNYSSFAKFISETISKDKTILDVGCGNGRDTRFLEVMGYDVVGFDLVNVDNFLGSNFIKGDASMSIPKKDVYYCRFFLHTLTEDVMDKFLDNVCKTSPYSTIVIETRSTKGITYEDKSETNFKSSIGEEHFRMLYSMKYLFNKLEKKFDISYIHESNEFSVYNGESPYLIRVIAKPKTNYLKNRKNLKEIVSFLDKNNIDYIVFYGTLLGICRDGDLIHHDDDVDILVHSSYYKKLKNMICDPLNFPNLTWFLGHNKSFINFHRENGVTTDLYFYYPMGDYYVEEWNFHADEITKEKHLHIPKDLIEEKQYFDMGDFKVKVPKKMNEVCEFLYGERYKETLIKDVDYKTYIKNNKPNHVYF